MAQVKKISWDAIPLEKRVTVGHNRTIHKPHAGLLYCSLHDNTVAIFRKAADGSFDVTLDHCGWLGTVTMAAINDFLKFAGISARVSRAKGKFSVRYQIKHDVYTDQAATDDGQRIYFNAPYVSPWSHCVVIGDCFPMVAAIKAKGEYSAQLAERHLSEMFPHLRDCLSIVKADDMTPNAYTPATNALRDCCAAFCNTGNGAKFKPSRDHVALWEGGKTCGKDS